MDRASGARRKKTVSKNTGSDRTNAVAPSATASRFSPSTLRNPATMRSAAPLSVIAVPMMAASAMTMPMLPAVRPNASATREIFTACSPGARKLTTIAAPTSARNAFSRRPMIAPMITTMPISRMTKGCIHESVTLLSGRVVRLVIHRHDARSHAFAPNPRRHEGDLARPHDRRADVYPLESLAHVELHLVRARWNANAKERHGLRQHVPGANVRTLHQR